MAVAENTGYPVGWFKNQDIAKDFYECVICLEVVKDAVQLRDCGHLFCRYCIDNVLKLQAQCPTCRNEMSEEMIFPDKNANRAIGKLEVNCPSTGCEWDGTLNSLLQEHNASCPFLILNCNNMGCDVQVIRQELEDHLTKCEHRTVVCEHCSSEHMFKDKDEHLSTCPFLPVECESKCSGKKIPRNEMNEHLDTICSKTVIKCKYSEFGCEYQCERQEMEEHQNQATNKHLELSVLEISGLKEKFEIDKNEIKEWKTKHENDIKELKSKLEIDKNEIKKWKTKHQNDIKELKSKLEIDKNEIKKWKTKHENDIKELKSKHKNDIKLLTSKHQKDAEELKKQINQIVLMSNCSFIQKISNFENKLASAKSSDTENIIKGEPFFSSYYGYKMRLLIYLVEGSSGCADHMGVYISFMRSDHDGMLAWPFKKRLVFSVIDQQDDEHCRVDVVTALDPEGEVQFQRPQQDENEGLGYQKFISHSKLRTRRYIKDDTVYIRVQVQQ